MKYILQFFTSSTEMVEMIIFCVSRFDLQLYMFESYSNEVSLLTSENDISNALKSEKETKLILSAIEGEFDIESFKFSPKDSLVFKFGGSQKGVIFCSEISCFSTTPEFENTIKKLTKHLKSNFLSFGVYFKAEEYVYYKDIGYTAEIPFLEENGTSIKINGSSTLVSNMDLKIMNKEEFVSAIRLVVKDSTNDIMEQKMSKLDFSSYETNAWLSTLDEMKKQLILDVVKEAVDHSVFGFLCVLDGVRVIESGPNKGELVLIYKGNHEEVLNDPKTIDLHDLY